MKLLPAPIVTNAVINGVIVQTTRPSGAQFFSVNGVKFYTDYVAAEKTRPKTESRVRKVNYAFYELANNCNHREYYTGGYVDLNCHHPDMDFKHMLCCVQNCPLLLD